MTTQFYKIASSLQEKLLAHGQCFVKIHKGYRKSRNIFLSDFYFYVLTEDRVKYKLSLNKITKVIVSNNSAEMVLLALDKSVLIDNLNFRSAFLKELSSQKYNIEIIDVKEPLLDEYVQGEKEDARQQGVIINLRLLQNQYKSYGGENKKIFDELYKIEECIHKDQYFSILIVSEIKVRDKKKKKKDQLRKFTAKVYNKQLIGQNKILLKKIFNEKKFLEQIMSLYVPTLYKCTFSKTYIYCLTELYSGETLQSYLKNQTLDKKNVKLLLGQIVIALGQLHECGLVYGNVNVNGIFVTDKGYILLNDFSRCHNIEQKHGEDSEQKVIENQNQRRSSKFEHISDWTEMGKLIFRIKEGVQWNGVAEIPQYKQKELTNLIKALILKKVEERLGFKNDYHQILGHEYFKGVSSKDLATQKCDPLKKFFTVNYNNFNKQNLQKYLQGQDWSIHDTYLKDYDYCRELQ